MALEVLTCTTCGDRFFKKGDSRYKFKHLEEIVLKDYYCSDACLEGISPAQLAKCGHTYRTLHKSEGKLGITWWTCLACMKSNRDPEEAPAEPKKEAAKETVDRFPEYPQLELAEPPEKPLSEYPSTPMEEDLGEVYSPE